MFYQNLLFDSFYKRPEKNLWLLTSNFQLPTFNFWLLTSIFQLSTFDFRLMTSNFQLLTSNFKFMNYKFVAHKGVGERSRSIILTSVGCFIHTRKCFWFYIISTCPPSTVVRIVDSSLILVSCPWQRTLSIHQHLYMWLALALTLLDNWLTIVEFIMI